MSSPSRQLTTWALVCGLLTLLAAHPLLFDRNEALVWVLCGLFGVSLIAIAIEVAGRVDGGRCPLYRSGLSEGPELSGSAEIWRRHLLTISVALFLVGNVLSFCANKPTSPTELAPWAFGLLLLGLGKHLGTDDNTVELLACAAVGLGCVVAGYAVFQHLGLDPLPASTVFPDRTLAVFENPNHLGSFMAVLLPIALGGFLHSCRLPFPASRGIATEVSLERAARWSPEWWARTHLVWYPATALLYAALLLAGSRGAWVGSVTGFAVLLWMMKVDARASGLRLHRMRILAMALTLITVTLWLVPTPVMENDRGAVTVGQRMLSTANAITPQSDETLSHRYFLWQVAWQLIQERPLVGVGPGRFADHADSPTAEGWSPNPWAPFVSWHPHNEFLNYWAQGGILTLLGLLGIVLSAYLRSRDSARASLSAVSSGAGTSVLVHGLVSYPLCMPVTAILFWVLLGIMNVRETDQA